MTVRVRIAPAPSGSLHIGNVRTALFNWLFARRHGGVFMLRVEDTDPTRVLQEHYQTVKDDLRWMGLDWDEGPDVGGPFDPYLQSQRVDFYRETSERLIELGAAYRCYCTSEELKQRREQAMAEGRPSRYDKRCYRLTDAQRTAYEEEGRPFVIRLHVPEDGETRFDDLVTGPVVFRHSDLNDVVLVRSDGSPLYNIAATADDGVMKISHVVRGLDLQSSTPYQIIMHRHLGNEVPQYAHLPLINGPDGRPLSKRHGPTSLAWFRDSGYLPEAMTNYLALLGWGLGDETIISREELIKNFALEDVHPSPARFDQDKLDWINGEYIRMLDDADLAERLVPFLVGAGLVDDPPAEAQRELINVAATLVKPRMRRLDQAVGLARGLFTDDIQPDEQSIKKAFGREGVGEFLSKASDVLAGLDSWSRDEIESALRSVVEDLGMKPRQAYLPLYVAIHGSTVGAPIFESMEIIGKEKTLERIERARLLISPNS